MENTILSKLNCTEDALKFGKNASVEELQMLADLREMCIKEVVRLMEVDRKERSNEALNAAVLFATKAQFCREAIEVSKSQFRMFIYA